MAVFPRSETSELQYVTLRMVDQELLNTHVSFFDADVLNLYRHHSHLYKVTFDYFMGSLSSIHAEADDEVDSIQSHLGELTFGCRTKADGSVAIAVLNYELREMPAAKRKKWAPFALELGDLTPFPDKRFQMWYDSQLEGDWDVGNPPLMRLAVVIHEVNQLTLENLDEALFKEDFDNDLCFPISENSAAYDKAHAKLYTYLIDGLRKEALKKLANKFSVSVNVDSSKTLDAIRRILTNKEQSNLWEQIESSLQPVQKARRRDAHEARASVFGFPAFETFVKDLEPIIDSFSALKGWIAKA